MIRYVPKKDIWDPSKREAGSGGGGTEGRGAEINAHQRQEELSHGTGSPIGNQAFGM